MNQRIFLSFVVILGQAISPPIVTCVEPASEPVADFTVTSLEMTSVKFGMEDQLRTEYLRLYRTEIASMPVQQQEDMLRQYIHRPKDSFVASTLEMLRVWHDTLLQGLPLDSAVTLKLLMEIEEKDSRFFDMELLRARIAILKHSSERLERLQQERLARIMVELSSLVQDSKGTNIGNRAAAALSALKENE